MSVRVNSELEGLRVVAPSTHNILGVIPSKGTFPLATTKTGTITSTPSSSGADNKRAVVGAGTLFLTELQPGDYIYAGDVLRMVTDVSSNTLLFVNHPFPATVTAAALKVVRAGKYKIIIASSTGSADAIYQEAKFEAGQVSAKENEMGLAPVSYDVSAVNSEITFELSE